VRWFLSVEESVLSVHVQGEGAHAYGSVLRDDEAIEFSPDFRDLHTTVYQETLAGRGPSIEHARSSIELAYRVRTQPGVRPHDSVHAALQA
jgi:hypothetical protein